MLSSVGVMSHNPVLNVSANRSGDIVLVRPSANIVDVSIQRRKSPLEPFDLFVTIISMVPKELQQRRLAGCQRFIVDLFSVG